MHKKHQLNIHTTETYTGKSKEISKNENKNSALNRGQEEKLTFHNNHLRRTNHANFIKLWRTVEDSIGYQFDPAGHTINFSNKTFTKDVYKLLNKNLKLCSN